MSNQKGLLIVHVDGLGFELIQKALKKGKMPFLQSLLEKEYELLPYHGGIPSTTPFVQAGILYGNNKEIPSFRWWDKQSGVDVRFGPRSTFTTIAHKYFQKDTPLLKNGAAIGACFPAGAREIFALAFRNKELSRAQTIRTKLFWRWLRNPYAVINWLIQSSILILSVAFQYANAKIQGKKTAAFYLVGDILDELFLHQLSRFATRIAMQENLPVIYTALYAFDESAHAFGPEDYVSVMMLKRIDETIKYFYTHTKAKGKQKRDYEIVVLSDHSQVPTIFFKDHNGSEFRELIGKILPTYKISDTTGTTHINSQSIDGHIKITCSGGLGHLYFTDISTKLQKNEINKKFPQLITKILNIQEIAALIVEDGDKTLFQTKTHTINLKKLLGAKDIALLKQYGDPKILQKQLLYLASFQKSGDIILVGKITKDGQINFEAQAGGHGSIGLNQDLAFLLAKKEHQFITNQITNATNLHKLLMKLAQKAQ